MNKLYKGIIAMVIFYIFNNFIMHIVGSFIFVGDPFTISYHMFTYTGLMTLCGVIVVCTYIIVGKLNEVKDLLGKSDNQKDE